MSASDAAWMTLDYAVPNFGIQRFLFILPPRPRRRPCPSVGTRGTSMVSSVILRTERPQRGKNPRVRAILRSEPVMTSCRHASGSPLSPDGGMTRPQAERLDPIQAAQVTREAARRSGRSPCPEKPVARVCSYRLHLWFWQEPQPGRNRNVGGEELAIAAFHFASARIPAGVGWCAKSSARLRTFCSSDSRLRCAVIPFFSAAHPTLATEFRMSDAEGKMPVAPRHPTERDLHG
jgi:hypothetical protein